MRGLIEHLRRVQESLGRNAANVEAGPAERLHLLDHGDVHAKLRRAYRANIAPRARADHHKVITHCTSLSLGAPMGLAPTPATIRSTATASSPDRQSKSSMPPCGHRRRRTGKAE